MVDRHRNTPVGSEHYRRVHYIKPDYSEDLYKRESDPVPVVATVCIFVCSAVIAIAVLAYFWFTV